MSFQRVMETARRLNLPMVITDVAGREPMVVMSLGVYERMLEETQVEQKAPEIQVPPRQIEETSLPKPVLEPEIQVFASPVSEKPSFEVMFTETLGVPDVESPLALEERFYLTR